MTNKGVKTMVRALLALMGVLLLSVTATAQTYLTTTTLTNAVNATQNTFVLGSATGLAAGAGLYVDREFVTVRSVSSLTVTVNRGQSGTVANSHAASATVILIPAAAIPTVVSRVDPGPIFGTGGCTVASQPYWPLINVLNGNVWVCRWVSNARVFAATNNTLITYGSLIMQ